ncbi:arsenate reductase [Nitrosomonas cryotolerans]|uniref:Arsenate reductase n=1 Tax=Nitrosomonas cryotolerans ATCC 49181 TaxID=1131553 RepID=A0A1N6FTJ6_9PROT|nr:ArsC/Spx/MgsR family protein [Nitrosomonas cryotolerans]SFP76837.1 arsenate reductase [Nitrosomonas cryotolerans]SIN98615.1 arsenate reductase [Nitrosomonas cryotolerans ATCC 49181]
MNDKITIYQKPTCSKCKATLAILEENNVAFESINYYETPITVEDLKALIQKLNLSLRDVLRKEESIAINFDAISDEELIKIMVDNPDLIQRPIVVRGDKAILCRPAENVKILLE